MTIAVVSGPAERLHSLAVALRNEGFVAVVFDGPELAQDVRADGTPLEAPATRASLAEIAPHLPFCDWRNEVLSLTSGSAGTYFGWATEDGRWHAAVLRGAVLSPLRSWDLTTTPDAPARCPEEAVLFARTVLADAGGESARCPRCEGAGCGACHASGLAQWIRRLVDEFVAEVLGILLEQYIEVPAGEVNAWLQRRIGDVAVRDPRRAGDSTPATRRGAVSCAPPAEVANPMDDLTRYPSWRGRPGVHNAT